MRVYVAHPIRGKKGSHASRKDMEYNNNKAINFAADLRGDYSELEFYVPAEHDEALGYIWRKGWITITQLLEADCSILEQCDALLLYDHENYLGSGMRAEKKFAEYKGIPVFVVKDLVNPEDAWKKFEEWFNAKT